MSEPSLTPAQHRVVLHCRSLVRPGNLGWVSLEYLETIRILEDDDVLTVPSLIEAGLLEYSPAIQGMVRAVLDRPQHRD